MESMWEFHFKLLETLRSSILAVATNSLTTTGLKAVVFLVLKFMRSSLHFVSFSWNFSDEARVDQGVDGHLNVTVLVLAYCLRDGRIVDAFPEIVGRNIKLVDHHDGQPWPQTFGPWGTPASTTPDSEKQSWPSLTRCLREVRKSMIQKITGSGMSHEQQLPDQNPVVNEVERFLKFKEKHPYSDSITVSGTVPGVDHAN